MKSSDGSFSGTLEVSPSSSISLATARILLAVGVNADLITMREPPNRALVQGNWNYIE